MNTPTNTIEALANQEYKYGFVTEIESDVAPRGLNGGVEGKDRGGGCDAVQGLPRHGHRRSRRDIRSP
jgi:hypothetical protein